jgi:hypothetical protein
LKISGKKKQCEKEKLKWKNQLKWQQNLKGRMPYKKKVDLKLVFCKLKTENKPVAKALLFSK